RRVPHLLHQQPWRRGDGQHLVLPRSLRARAPGGVGGLAERLPADPAVPVVAPARRVSGGVIAPIAGVPIEEMLPVAGGAGGSLLMARAWIALRFRRR